MQNYIYTLLTYDVLHHKIFLRKYNPSPNKLIRLNKKRLDMKNVIIIIPIYKNQLNSSENESLLQCINILGDYPIKFICPTSLNLQYYKDIINRFNKNITFEKFNDRYFLDLNSYSKLLLNLDFYNRISDYEYLLIYQLDAWVFQDKLEYWVTQNFDYIGAPWIDNNYKFCGVGNGGFSLRKIKSSKELVSKNIKCPYSLIKCSEYNYNKHKNNIFNTLKTILKYYYQLFKPKKLKELCCNEDAIFGIFAPKLIPNFKTAPPEIALKFSFEQKPKYLYKINNKKLPFGCHAFEKYDWEFFSKHINLNK